MSGGIVSLIDNFSLYLDRLFRSGVLLIICNCDPWKGHKLTAGWSSDQDYERDVFLDDYCSIFSLSCLSKICVGFQRLSDLKRGKLWSSAEKESSALSLS